MFKKAEKQVLKLKLAIDGPSGSGKTFSALKIASGLVGDGGKICVIDTENNSASLYADLFDFDIGVLGPPYTPERFIEILRNAETAGYDCIIIDSISHEWRGSGGILDIQGKSQATNSFASWGKITPRHDNFIHAIIGSPVHIIATMRSKQGYVLEERNKKQVPVKVGMEPVQRDGIEYEFTCVFSLSLGHEVTCTKDRTQMFHAAETFIPDETTGIKLSEWLSVGKKGKRITVSTRIKQLHECADLEELQTAFNKILSTRKSYSKTEMEILIGAKDAAKSRLTCPPDDDSSAADITPEVDESPPKSKPPIEKPEKAGKAKKATVPEEKPKLHPDVEHLKSLYEDPAYAADFASLDSQEIEYAINHNKAVNAKTLIEEAKIGG